MFAYIKIEKKKTSKTPEAYPLTEKTLEWAIENQVQRLMKP